MNSRSVLFVLLVGLMLRPSLVPAAELPKTLDIPYTRFVLRNGLTLVVHEDHKAPIVAVNVWYHVGSKNEKLGKTGFAHLFEHLMFNGSEHFDDDYFKAMEQVGASELNGTTNHDRTNYFQNAPKEALDFLLWMESDRMGHLLGAITQEKLDEQRGVVQNEKRQHENQPYGLSNELITKGTFPPGHPYSWTVIGSMEDLNAASLEDVHEWFKAYYGAANATIVVAGDVDPATVREKVERYFGHIPSGPPLARHDAWIAKRTGSQRQIAQDRVPQARVYKVWNIPPYGSLEGDQLNLVSDVLAQGKSSRLYKRLVYDEQIASSVSAFVDLSEIAGRFWIVATARPGQDLKEVERALDEELARFLKDGPTRQELERIKTQYFAGFIRGIERIGGFGGKSDILAMNEVFTGQPDYYKTTLDRVRDVTRRNLRQAAREWLSDGVYILEIHPFPEHQTVSTEVDRSKLPVPALSPEVRFPGLQRTNLSNGLRVVLAERHDVPLVELRLLIDAGYSSDQFTAPGTARLAMDMLDEGTRSRTALDIDQELARLGASLRSGSSLDSSSVSLSALKENLQPSLELFGDVILNPAFPVADFERLKKQQLDSIQREKTTPVSMGLRVLPKLLYGEGHAYATPFTGSGDEQSVSKLTHEDMRKFHSAWFKPNNATLLVVGDTTLAEMTPRLERLFAGWRQGEVASKNVSTVQNREQPVLFLVDRPGSIQSVIFAGLLAPPKSNPEEIALQTMNDILGGTFTSRINMNLREDKHWSYGAQTMIPDARGQRPYLLYAAVQTDKTKESIQEARRELEDISSDRPITTEELATAQKRLTLSLAGEWETIGSVLGSMDEIVRFGLADDHFQQLPTEILALNLDDVTQAAKAVVRPNQLVWVVVGDRAKIHESLSDLGFGEIKLISL